MRELKYYVRPKKNVNVSEESVLFSEHRPNGENYIFLARLIPLLGQFLNEQGKTLFYIYSTVTGERVRES